MRGSIPPLPNTSSCSGDQLKKAQAQLHLTFNLTRVNTRVSQKVKGLFKKKSTFVGNIQTRN
jgi:hypothetical protein